MKNKLLWSALAGSWALLVAILVQVAPTILEKVWGEPKPQTALALHWMRERPGTDKIRFEHVFQFTNTTSKTMNVTAWWRGLDDLSIFNDGLATAGPDPARSRTFDNKVTWSRVTITGTSDHYWADVIFTVDGKSVEIIEVPPRHHRPLDFLLVRAGADGKLSRRKGEFWPK